MPKDNEGYSGRWVTIHGTHIFIRDGEELKDAMNRQFDNFNWEEDDASAKYADAILSNFTYAVTSPHVHYLDKNGNRIKPKEFTQSRVRNAIERRGFTSEVDHEILNALVHNVEEFILKDSGTCFFDYDTERINVNVNTTIYNILDSISHEVAHALDHNGGQDYTFSYHSSNHNGLTMDKCFEQEFKDNFSEIEIVNARDHFDEQLRRLRIEWNSGKLSDAQYSRQRDAVQTARTSFADCVQAIYGDETVKRTFNFYPHKKGYFGPWIGKSCECFAQLTASLFSDKEKNFYNFIKSHCPDTVEIYHEILKEAKSKWRK